MCPLCPGCLSPKSDARACGGCGNFCRLDEVCCEGRCVRHDDPATCGGMIYDSRLGKHVCGRQCAPNQACCADGSPCQVPFQCTP